MKKITYFLLIIFLFITSCSLQEKINLTEFSSKEGRMSVLLPGVPNESIKTLNSDVGTIDLHIFDLDKGDIYFAVSYSDYPDSLVKSLSVSKHLDNAREGALANTMATLTAEEIIEVEGYEGRLLSAKIGEDYALRAKFFLVGNRLYQLIIVTNKNNLYSSHIKEVIDSFKSLK